MIETPYYFDMDLFEGGTLLDGEVVKNENNKWIFIINDIAYYKGESLIVKSFEERQMLIDNMLENQIDRVREDISMTYITKKIYFNYNNLQDMCGRFKDSLSYKSSGIYFKNINNYSDNYLYMFPDCRTDYQVLHSDEVLKENKIDVVGSVQQVKRIEEVKKDDKTLVKATDKGTSPKNPTILVADDDEITIKMIPIMLMKLAGEVMIVKTGVEAIEVCRGNPNIDLVLMDIFLPEIDGLETTSQIRQFNK
jgi:hypothetical protein